MGQAFNVTPQTGTNAGSPVAGIDTSGNETLSGALYLLNQAAAPPVVAGATAVYANSSGTITTIGPNGAATGSTVTGNLSVSGTTTLTGLETLNGGTATAGSAPVLTPTFASGTAAQLADLTRDYMVYLTIGTAGTANTLAIGPTSTPANTLISNATATTGEMMVVRLPAGWFLKWTATTATLATQTAIGC